MREFYKLYTINQFLMRTRGKGVKKSGNFADVIDGCSLCTRLTESGAIPPLGNEEQNSQTDIRLLQVARFAKFHPPRKALAQLRNDPFNFSERALC